MPLAWYDGDYRHHVITSPPSVPFLPLSLIVQPCGRTVSFAWYGGRARISSRWRQRHCKAYVRADEKMASTLIKTAVNQFSDISFFSWWRSAYHHYSKINNPIVKDELIKEGKDTSLGVLVSAVSAKVQWTNFFIWNSSLQVCVTLIIRTAPYATVANTFRSWSRLLRGTCQRGSWSTQEGMCGKCLSEIDANMTGIFSSFRSANFIFAKEM